MDKDHRIYRYSRGDKYSCHVAVINGDHVVFSNIQVPLNTPSDVSAKMLDDAEAEALKLYQQEFEKQFSV